MNESIHEHHMHQHHMSDTGAMVMAGIPDWLYYTGIALILILSFIIVEILNKGSTTTKSYKKFNLLTYHFIKRLIKTPYFRFLFQFPLFLIFCLIIYAGIAGHGIINIAPVLTWTIWWAGLVLLVLFFGKAWCYICPWDFAATLLQHMKPFGVAKKPLTLGLEWPAGLKNIYLATGLFIVLTFIELGFKVTSSPRDTAVLAIVILLLSLGPALIFEKRSFCKYGCLVGRISGLYAMFSPIEIRSVNKKVCQNCKTQDCFNGNRKGNPCPTSLLMPEVNENTYCILCTECIKSCPHDNVAVNLRPFGTDLRHFKEVRKDEALLAIIMLALTSFHGITMTEIWESSGSRSVTGAIKALFNTGPLASFAIAMAGINLAIIAIYRLFCTITAKFAGQSEITGAKVFLYYAYSILPVALFYHLAHNSMHLFMEGQNIIPLLSDPLGEGKNYFGTATLPVMPLLSDTTVWLLQVFLIVTGHVAGIVIAHHISKRLYTDTVKARRSLIPILIVMILSSLLSLWIVHLDMDMRSSFM